MRATVRATARLADLARGEEVEVDIDPDNPNDRWLRRAANGQVVVTWTDADEGERLRDEHGRFVARDAVDDVFTDLL